MSKFVCFENEVITSVLNYEPNVPSHIHVVEITDQQYIDVFEKRTHTVNEHGKLSPVSAAKLSAATRNQQNMENLAFLANTDWIVLRYIREKALGLQTSITEDKYIELERQRQQAADNIQQ